MHELIDWIGTGLLAYLALGLAFAVPFAWRWVDRIDPGARSSGLGFRLMIAPGVIALWPWLLRRLATGGEPIERNAHEEQGR